MKRHERLCNTRAAPLSHNLRHKLPHQQPSTASSAFTPTQTLYSFSTVCLTLGSRRYFGGPWRAGTCTMICLLKGFSHVSAACCPTRSSFQAKRVALMSLAPSSAPQLGPGLEAASRHLQTVLSGFRFLLEQTVEYALEHRGLENYFQNCNCSS